MAVGSYYNKANTKLILEIASADTSDDTLLDALGALADQHIDNIFKIHDEKIPLQGANVLNDIKMAANYYTASLYKSKRGDLESADWFMKQYQGIILGMTERTSIEGQPYIVERFNSRFITGQEDIFALW